MRKFRTEIEIPVYPFKISHSDTVLAAGSCFADAIGGYLKKYKFSVWANPWGILYNPISIHHSFFSLPTSENWLLHHDGRWLHYGLHSQMNADTREHLQLQIIERQQNLTKYLDSASLIILTYGTAWVYEHNHLQSIVANCHKQPAQLFTKRMLALEEIMVSFSEFYQKLPQNNRLKIIVTVSPVRHTKDTLLLNQASKSLLRYACHLLTERHENVYYFPAYEMVMDDLRDYRFYKSDLIHPTADAEEYVWDKFSEAFFSLETQKFLTEWNTVLQALQHKPFNPASAAHQKFILQTLQKIEKWNGLINVSQEIDFLKAQLL